MFPSKHFRLGEISTLLPSRSFWKSRKRQWLEAEVLQERVASLLNYGPVFTEEKLVYTTWLGTGNADDFMQPNRTKPLSDRLILLFWKTPKLM